MCFVSKKSRVIIMRKRRTFGTLKIRIIDFVQKKALLEIQTYILIGFILNV